MWTRAEAKTWLFARTEFKQTGTQRKYNSEMTCLFLFFLSSPLFPTPTTEFQKTFSVNIKRKRNRSGSKKETQLFQGILLQRGIVCIYKEKNRIIVLMSLSRHEQTGLRLKLKILAQGRAQTNHLCKQDLGRMELTDRTPLLDCFYSGSQVESKMV